LRSRLGAISRKVLIVSGAKSVARHQFVIGNSDNARFVVGPYLHPTILEVEAQLGAGFSELEPFFPLGGQSPEKGKSG
jgi:hypothetical protein